MDFWQTPWQILLLLGTNDGLHRYYRAYECRTETLILLGENPTGVLQHEDYYSELMLAHISWMPHNTPTVVGSSVAYYRETNCSNLSASVYVAVDKVC